MDFDFKPARSAVAVLLAAAGLCAAATPPAQAQTLIDLLFKPRQQPVAAAPAPFPAAPAPQPKPKPKPVAKVEPPSFKPYVTDRMAVFSAAKVMTGAPVSIGASGGFTLAEGVAITGDVSLRSEKPVVDAMTALYGGAPDALWVDGAAPNGAATAVLRHLADAASYGLDPQDYAVALPSATLPDGGLPARIAELTRFEFALSAAVMRYIRDVEGLRITPGRISGFYDFAPKVPDLAAAAAAVARDGDPAAALARLHPQEPEYEQLRRALRALPAGAAQGVPIAAGTLIKPGAAHAELPRVIEALRRSAPDRLLADHAITLAAAEPIVAYDAGLVAFVKDWQAAKGLKPDGVIGARTISAAQGVSDATKRERIILALEQMRWFPDSFGGRYVLINQPAFTATYYDNNVPELTTRTVIGTRKNQTYLFHDIIEYVEFNPTWGVPRSIIVNEFLPKLRANPGWLDAKGYEVYNAKGQKIPSSSVNWSAVGSSVPVSVIQPGGDGNALGDLKIMFPNTHSIYMHDTPARDLFARDVRAFSHGCVRLQQPHEMAAKVLGISLADVEGRLAKPTNRMNVKQRLPVFLAYFTAWPDETGAVSYFDDIYERDLHLRKALDATRAARASGS